MEPPLIASLCQEPSVDLIRYCVVLKQITGDNFKISLFSAKEEPDNPVEEVFPSLVSGTKSVKKQNGKWSERCPKETTFALLVLWIQWNNLFEIFRRIVAMEDPACGPNLP